MKDLIYGIQQVGIGVSDADEAKQFYRNDFGMDVKVFDDVANASLMVSYTGHIMHQRRAILAMNLAGGGGFEIWQFLSRSPASPNRDMKPGDLGIFAARIKSGNIQLSHRYFENEGNHSLTPISLSPANSPVFWVKDPYNNWFQFTESREWFKKSKGHCGGVSGAVIGVSDMEKALHFYRDVLGIRHEVYNIKGHPGDMPSGSVYPHPYHRVLLRKDGCKKGAFSKLLGDVEIELVQVMDTKTEHIYRNRFWGDCGFIHLCFDIPDMDVLKARCEQMGYRFTVDSNSSFAMDKAAGRFCYVEDPDGTLIELVETHKIPLVKKLGLYLDLKKRKTDAPLPSWIIACMGLSKIKQ